jgi:hypothetical protein
MNPSATSHRREILAAAAAAGCGLGLTGKLTADDRPPRGKAEHVISVWLGGGMGQIDTFDPKRKGDPKKRVPGAYYDSIETAVPGVRVCEHLPQLAPLMDRVTAVRSVHHEVIDEHAAATNRMHTGRPISGTITYPSLGSIIAHQRGAADDAAPPYVLIGYPNVTRGPGFLGAQHGYLYLNGIGWDVHNEGILNQHKLIRELDTAMATLISDLEDERMLDKTLIVVTTEFGRPPEFDGGGGRGHQGTAFSCVLAGGGLSHRGGWGETDELSKKIVADPVGVPDLFATICAAVGVDHHKNLYDGDRPVPITDRGNPIAKLFA